MPDYFKKTIKFKINQRLPLIVLAVLAIAALGFVSINHPSAAEPKIGKESKFLAQKWLAQCYKQECINSGLKSITAQQGTEAALDALEYYKHYVSNYLPGDDHLRAHQIGEQTFISYGLSSKVVLRCGTDFNYGCMHGYIEEAEAKIKGSDSLSLSKILCDPIEDSSNYSFNMKHFCYHGIGHAIMEDVDYDLQAALDQCDQLKDEIAQNGCWQGVFMENVFGFTSGETDNGTFSKTDPLAPCDAVAKKYQSQCYVNQEGYLFSYFHMDVYKAAQACLAAGDQTGNCIEGIGLSASSEVWQPVLLKDKNTGSIESNAWLICQQFPTDYITSCVTGAVFQLLEADGLNFSRASKFCGLVGAKSQNECFRSIGRYAGVEAARGSQSPASYCSQLPLERQTVCRQGAGERSGS